MVDSTTSPVPVRLRYEDADKGTEIIGTMFSGGQDIINTATLKNSGPEFNKLVIEGEQELQTKIPVSEQTFADARNGEREPEIIVEVDRGNGWEIRDRVYALDGGNVDDDGNYKNTKLYGHEKYTGNQRVEVTTPVETHVVDALEQVLPPGYTVDAPTEQEIANSKNVSSYSYPEVNNYTYRGLRQNAYVDLSTEQGTLNEKWVIIFTSELDSNNDYKVRFEPQGYGGKEGDVSRRNDPIAYDYWRKKDASTVVSKVTAKGIDTDNTVQQVTATASNAALTNAETVNIDYIVGADQDNNNDNKELKSIAEANLQPDFVEHGAFEGPLYIENTVNFTVGVFDSERNIDDEFTVVEQKDYFHQGETYFSFVFENNANVQGRVKDKKSQGKFDSLFGTDQTDVGGQQIDQQDSNTTTAFSDNSTQEDNQEPLIDGFTGSEVRTVEDNFNFTGASISNGGVLSLTTDAPFVSGDAEFALITANLSLDAAAGGSVRAIISNDDSGVNVFDETFGVFHAPASRTFTTVQTGDVEGDTFQLDVENSTGSSGTLTVDLTVTVVPEHQHSAQSNGGSLMSDPHVHNVNVNDAGHGDTSDPSTHELQGQTETGQTISTANEDKTDR